METTIERAAELSAADRDQVTAVAAAAKAVDGGEGFAPLNEHGVLQLRGSHAGVTHLLARVGSTDGAVVGYAQVEALDGTDETDDPVTLELVVAPTHRRTGVGTALARAAIELAAHRRLQAWAHGTTEAATAFARSLGFSPVRQLLLQSMTVDDRGPGLPPTPPPPDGVIVRPFVPGQDEDAWLAVNAAAFATHPEQGRWTRADLLAREAEDWFDPAGFLLAETTAQPRQVLGFHWTKLDGGVGEVYVLGIDPAAQGRGLGKVLLLAGLNHLRSRGASVVDLYVEADNTAARQLYEPLGFTTHITDTMYERATDTVGDRVGGSQIAR